jgi:hypothetical protein
MRLASGAEVHASKIARQTTAHGRFVDWRFGDGSYSHACVSEIFSLTTRQLVGRPLNLTVTVVPSSLALPIRSFCFNLLLSLFILCAH